MYKFRPTAGVVVIPSYIDQRKEPSMLIVRVLTETPIVQATNSDGAYLCERLNLEEGEYSVIDIPDIEQRLNSMGLIVHEESFRQMLLHCVYNGCGFTVEKR